MLGCRSLFRFRFRFRINLLPRRTTITCSCCGQPKPLLYFQKYKLCHGSSCNPIMDGRKRRVDIGPKNQKNVTQAWRAVSTHPNFPEAESSKNDASLDEKSLPPEKHLVSMEVGQSLMRFIKGKEGVTQAEIETEDGVKITFPSSKTEDFITIEGNSAESVSKASEKIQIVIDKAVNSRDLDYSHFVSLPLAIHPGLVDKLVKFQNAILGREAEDKDKNVNSDTVEEEEEEDQQSTAASEAVVKLKAEKNYANDKVNITSDDQHFTKAPVVAELKDEVATTNKSYKVNPKNIPLVSYRPKELKAPASETSSSKPKESGIEKSIFIKPKTFHITVLMLKLWNKDRVKSAADVLQSVLPRVIDALENKPIMVRLKGLECMRGSLDKARVLYAPVEIIGGEGRLLHACKIITDAFVDSGLVIEKDVQQNLKLHATVMNARHRKRKKGTRKMESFDARGVFELYGSEEWGEYPLREAHLSQRFAFDENGYYHCCSSISFPEEMQMD